jgi:hypothetical protein
VFGSAPTGFHRWTVKISESLRGSSSSTTSVGVLERDAAVPIQLTIDAHRGECRRERTGRHDVPHVQLAAAAVEIRHLAGTHVRRSDRKARVSVVDQIEVDELGESRFERRRRVV